MDSRKVIKIKESYYINIPSEAVQALGIVKGDRLKIINIPGSGLLVTQIQGAGKVSVDLQSIGSLQKVGDSIYSQLERRVKDLESNFLSNLHASIIKDLVKIGVFDLKREVEGVKKQVEESNKGRGRLTLVHKSKRNTH